MQRKCPSLGGQQADHCDEGGWYFDKDYLRIAAASKISTVALRSITFIVFIVALCNFRSAINSRLQEYVMRDCSFCMHLTLALVHLPIGVMAIVGMYLAASRETQASDVHFAVTKIAFTLEDKLDLLLILYVLVVIHRHYRAVKGVFEDRRLAREREIMSSECWDSELGSDRSGSVLSRASSGVYNSPKLGGGLLNTSRFDIKESDAKAADSTKPRFKSGQYTSNERLYAEGIATLFLKHAPYEAAQKVKAYH